MRLVLAILAFVALSYAQYCNSTQICCKEGVNCPASTDIWVSTFAAEGTYRAASNIITRIPQISEACTDTIGCWDANWDIRCDTTCKYVDIYGPGESCKPTDPKYKNGGCLSGTACNPTTSKCASVAQGGQCGTNGISDDVCVAGTFCNQTTNVCDSRKALNALCNTNYECIPTLVCTSRGSNSAATCQEPFVQAVNQACSNGLDCGAELMCDNQKCVAPLADGQTCGDGLPDCLDNADCVCGGKKLNSTAFTLTAPGKCENEYDLGSGFNSQSQINAYKSMQSCLQNSNCHDLWMSTGQLDLNKGPDQCIRKCEKGGFKTPFSADGLKYNSCVFGSASAVVVPAAFALLLLIAALLF